MRTLTFALAVALFSTSLGVRTAVAQMPTGWSTQVDGLATVQSSTDLENGGAFSANRSFLRATSLYTNANGTSFGAALSIGQFDYEFSQASSQPWKGIQDVRISLPMRFQASETANVFISPQIRWDYQTGVQSSDGQTFGVFGGVSWKIRDNLTIGPAFGAFTQLEQDEVEVFPALLINWDINSRWNLNTGTGLGATQGPGLTLKYATTDAISVSVTARSEKVRFRLDNKGLAPRGVGEDSSIPVVLSFDYTPNPGFAISAFAGAEFNGQLSLDDANGTTISTQSYETAPIAGLAVRVRF